MKAIGICRPVLTAFAAAAAVLAGCPLSSAGDGVSCADVDAFGLRRFPRYADFVAACDAGRDNRAPGASSVDRDAGAARGANAEGQPVVVESFSANGLRERSIYIDDDRIEAEQITTVIGFHPKNSLIVRASRATVALVDSSLLQPEGSRWKLTLQKPGVRLCNDQNFHDQPVAPWCTGFLVAPDVIATAGHCVRPDQSDQTKHVKSTPQGQQVNAPFRVVFGFETRNGVARDSFAADEIYEAGDFIDGWAIGNGDTRYDYALFRLDRPVKESIAVPLRLPGLNGAPNYIVGPRTTLGVIGHPVGMPKKVSFVNAESNIALESGKGNIFRSQLNVFHGNSGSPVLFYEEPDVVAGILVSGEEDYVGRESDAQGPCARNKIYAAHEMCSSTGVVEPCSEKVTKAALISRYLAR